MLVYTGGPTADPVCGTAAAGGIQVGVTTISSGVTNGVLYQDASGLLREASPTANGILTYNGSGVPTSSTTLPSAVQLNITNLGTVTVGTYSANIAAATLTGGLTATGQTITGGTFTGGLWNGGVISPTYGGCGVANPTAHSLFLAEGALNCNFLTTGTAGNLIIDPGTGFDWASVPLSGDATIASTGAITVTKTNGAAFGPLATQTPPVLVSQGGTGQTTAPAARTAPGLNIDQLTTVGNINYQILATDRTVAHTTANRPITDTLPTAASVNPGQELYLTDLFGQFNSTTTLTIAAQGTDSVNGVGSVVAINAQYSGVIARSDGASHWSVALATGGGGGSGTVTQVQCAKGTVCSTITTTGTVTAPAALLSASAISGAI